MTRVTLAGDGSQLTDTDETALAAGGRYVAFTSDDDRLPGNDGFSVQVYVRDLVSGALTLVSRATDGTVGDDDSFTPVLSPNGRFVAYYSDSDVLDPRDTNLSTDAYLFDRDSDIDGVYDEAGAVTTRLVSIANGITADFGVNTDAPPGLTDDGGAVVFTTDQAFVTADQNDSDDVYVKLMAGGIRLISRSGTGDVEGGGGADAAISGAGRFVAFASSAPDLLTTPETDTLSDVFVFDRDTDGDGLYDEAGATATSKLSTAEGGGPANGASAKANISRDGTTVAFVTAATNVLANGLPGVVVRPRGAGSATWASPSFGVPNGSFSRPALAPNGSVVAFDTDASNLAIDTNGVRDVFVFALGDAIATRASVTNTGAQATAASFGPSVNADGTTVAFSSFASDLVPGDTNSSLDGFTWTRSTDTTPPSITMTAPANRWTTAVTSSTAWTATDPSGVSNTYGLQLGTALWNRAGVGWADTGAVTGTGYTLSPNVTGRTYCWRARATDLVGNVSAYAPARCSAVPLPAAATAYGPRWEAAAQTGAYRNAVLRTTTNGAKVTLDGVRASQLALVATTCRTCGAVSVRWNGALVASIDLSGRTLRRQRIFEIPAFPSLRTGSLVIQVTSPDGETVALEGIGIYQAAT